VSDLALEGVTKTFGSAAPPAIDGVSFEVRQGEFFSLLGPSGCGKSTLLRSVAGFVTPDAGRITIQGQDVTRQPPYRRDTAMVFQNYALFPHLTVEDNVAFGLRYRHVPAKERPGRVAEALELVRLDGLGKRYPSELSGGQQQRVAIARAVATRPALLLLDEPLSNLDFRLRVQMRSELLRIQRDIGVTTIFVTHDQGEAFSMSDRVVVLNAGKVLQVGTPQDIFERPSDPFIVDFIGGTNALDCVVTRTDAAGSVLTTRNGMTIMADPSPAGVAAVGRRVTVHLREEQLRLASEREAKNSFPATIVQAQYFGATFAYLVDTNGLELRVSLPNTPRNSFAVGAHVHLSFDPESVVVVDHG
jgi:ABC-type Fe3+/spermidine/putrescine transport system ATPase subunit